MATLFNWREQYPNQPGYKRRDTSEQAAKDTATRVEWLRQQCLNTLRRFPDGLTADEVAAAIKEDILSIRPRMSELARKGLIVDSKRRRKNRSGKPAIVWRLPQFVKAAA